MLSLRRKSPKLMYLFRSKAIAHFLGIKKRCLLKRQTTAFLCIGKMLVCILLNTEK